MATTNVDNIKSGAGQVAKTENSPQAQFQRFLEKFKPQMAVALPKHLNADRMCRLALTSFNKSPDLQKADATSIAASLMTASTLGLEPGVNGQGWLIPYYNTKKKIHICEFVPGWKGLVDIANRSGRCTVWTGAVFDGDFFEYQLGDDPFVKHRPGDEIDGGKLLYAYAVGRVNGSQYPVIEVWSAKKLVAHRNRYNKQGERHYSFRDWEMYARKVPLLQVLKYMPQSIELANAMSIAAAQDAGDHAILEGDFVSVTEQDPTDEAGDQSASSAPPPAAPKAPSYGTTFDKYEQRLKEAKNEDDGNLIVDEARSVLSEEQTKQLAELNKQRWAM